MTSDTDTQERVLAWLSRWADGRDNARTKVAAAGALGISTRKFEASVEALRDRGEAIGSGSEGYWLATSAAELAPVIDWLRGKALRQLHTYSRVKRKAARMRSGLLFDDIPAGAGTAGR